MRAGGAGVVPHCTAVALLGARRPESNWRSCEHLRGRVPSAALVDRHGFGAGRERNRFRVHQRVMHDDVRAFEQSRRPQREKVGRAGAGADEVDGAVHRTIPAATVLFVASSIRMKLPVAGLSA